MFMDERLNNSFENHSQCPDFSLVFQIKLEIFFFYLLKLMLEKCFYILIVYIKAA